MQMGHADPIGFALSPAGVAVRVQACATSAPVRVGLLLNARARRLRRGRDREALAELLPEAHAVVETPDLASVRRALATLLCVRGANVLAVAGGDGTVHHAVNALLELSREAELLTGVRPPLPRLLILNGGTLNIVGRTIAIHGPPRTTLHRFLRYFDAIPLSRLPARRLPLLEVRWGETAAFAPRFGFVFGSEAAFHAIELYGRFGAGYVGLSRFLYEFARGALAGSELWRAESWKLGPFHTPLRIDGQRFLPYSGVVASTVDLTLVIAAIRTIRRPLLEPGFAARVVHETDPARLVRLLPALMTERSAPGIADFPRAHRMDLFGPYTLDGECFSEPAFGSERLPLTVTLSEERLHAVPGDFTAEQW